MYRVFATFFVALLALTVCASMLWQTSLWGLSSWAFVSIEGGFVLAAGALVFLNRNIASRFLGGAPSRSRHPALKYAAILTAALVILWLLRMRHTLWGDRHAVAAALEAGIPVRPGAPLASLLNYVLFRVLNAVFLLNGASASALLSIATGVCYTAAALHAARLLFGDDESRTGLMAVSFAVLIANGFVAIFFGTGGMTPVAALASLLFIVSALTALRGKTSPIVPAILLVISIYTHLSALYLLPGFIYLVFHMYRSHRNIRIILESLGIVVLCCAVLDFVFSRVTAGTGQFAYLAGAINGLLEQARHAGWKEVPMHLLQAANGLLLVGPASAAVIVAIAAGKGGMPSATSEDEHSFIEERFLMLLAAFGVALFLAGAGLLGKGLRWEIFTATGPAFAAYLLWTLKRRIPDTYEFNRTAMLLVVIGIVHMLPWVVINASPTSAEKRLLSLPLEPGMGEQILGERALDAEEFETAETWFMKSVEMDSLNDRAYCNLGDLKMKEEEYVEAVQLYTKAHQLEPDNTEYRFKLAESFIAKQWFEEANYHLETLVESYPDSVRFWKRLGFARNHGGMFEQAIAAYERALELEPDNEQNTMSLASALLNRGAQLQEDKEFVAAQILYMRVIDIFPNDWRAYNNLATIEMELENYEGAYEILGSVLELHPFASNLNFNMGIVLEKLGRDREALEYLRRSVDLAPLTSKARPHIERLEEKLQKQEGK